MNTSPSTPRPITPFAAILSMVAFSVMVFIVIFVALGLAGCALDGKGAPTAVEVAQAKEVLAVQKDVAVAAKEKAVAAGDPVAAKKADKTLETLAKLAAALDQTTGADGGLDLTKLPGTAAALLPPPWGWVVGIGSVALTGLIGEARRRATETDAVSIINGFSSASAIPETGMRAALDKAEPVLKKELTPGALKLVNKHKLKKVA